MRTAISTNNQSVNNNQSATNVSNTFSKSPIIKEIVTQEEDGMYLQVKYTLRRPAKGRVNDLCTLIGKSSPAGNLTNNSKDGSVFFHSWLRPLVWKKEEGPQINNENGELARTEVNAYLMKRTSVQVDAQTSAIIAAIKKNPESASLLMGMLPAQSQELIKAALEGNEGWDSKKANLSILLDKLFGHQSIRVKATLFNEFKTLADTISDLDWSDDEGHAKDYSLVIRFPLVESLNAAAELKEMYDKANDRPYFVPGTDAPIMYKEIYVYPSYMAIVRGAERTKDLTKMISTDRVVKAFEAAWIDASESKKTFLSDNRLDNEASQINEWKTKIVAKTGKKWADSFKSELFALAPQVAVGNTEALSEAKNILTALKDIAAEGSNERITSDEAVKFSTAFDKAVEDAKTKTKAEPKEAEPIKVDAVADDKEDVSQDFDTDWDDILSLEGIIVNEDEE
jgi:hypothetical protein